ncbi:MAG: pyridoxal phosphate-dependent aminotransferase [Clostridiaceae bacterium]|nr:pyridoxal phosphate-dependent aminotransferase [Clostridiaceae bacterium]
MKLSSKSANIAASMTLAVDAKLKQMVADGIKVYGFGAGEPDFDTPKYIRDAAIEAINNGHTRYTLVLGILELRKAICAKLKRENDLQYEPNQIIVCSGAKHALSNTFAAILNPGDEVIIPVPYWVSYTEMIKLNDGIPVPVLTKKENNFKMTREELVKAITPKTKAILLNTPSNPTGAVYSEQELRDIAEVAVEHNLFVVSDEIYERIIYDGKKHISIASLGSEIKELTIVINGMSKSYAMTGWRLGYAAGNEKIIKAMAGIQGHAVSHPSSITQYASVAALNGPQDDLENMVKEFKKRRDYMYKRINAMEGISCIKPEGAFYVYVDISSYLGKSLYGVKINSSLDFSQIMLEKGHVAVIPGAAFGNDNYIRLSYATSMETIEKGLDAFEDGIMQ